MTSSPAPPCHLLYVDDSEADLEFMRLAFKKTLPDVQLTTVASGSEALKFMRAQPPYESRKAPDLVVMLDLKMPGMDGHEVLTEAKRDPKIAAFPFVMLTSSHLASDVDRSYALGALRHLFKPQDAVGYRDLARQIHGIWQGLAQAQKEKTE